MDTSIGMSSLDVATPRVQRVDFRRPNRVSREAVIALESQHETFARRLSTVWNSRAHAVVEIDHVATDQLSIDDFALSLAVPTALASVRVERMGTTMYVQIDLPIALLLVERLLGGRGDPSATPVGRRPTDLEVALLAEELIDPAINAIDEFLVALDGPPSTLVNFDTTPQPLRLGSASELLLLFTFRIDLHGENEGQGLLTLAYPVGPLLTHLDAVVGNTLDDPSERASSKASPLGEQLLAAQVDLQVHLATSELSATSVARLGVGDVLRLDHHVDQTARLVLDDHEIAGVHLGRRGRKVAVQIAQLARPSSRPMASTATTSSTTGTPAQGPTGAGHATADLLPATNPSTGSSSTPTTSARETT